MVELKVKKIVSHAIVPEYAHLGDAGLDFFSAEDYVISPGKRVIVSTGVSIEVPFGYVSLVWGKSGLSAKYGITVLGGVIDSGYRGEYKIILYNSGDDPFEIKRGNKVAQILIQKIENATISLVEDLEDSPRGEDKFGSTGV